MSKRLTSIAILGKGRAGSSLAAAIKTHPSYPLHSHQSGRSVSVSKLEKNGGPHVLIIAVRDDVIEQVAEEALKAPMPNLRLLVHLSGALSPAFLPELDGVARLALHPIQTFPKPDPLLFKGITFMGSSDARSAITWARSFTKAIGANNLFSLPPDSIALYHALVVLAANSITLLGGMVEELSPELGMKPGAMKRALAPLMRQSLENVLAHDAKEVLTGPFSRGDEKTIAHHRKALRTSNKEILALYNAIRAYATTYLKK